MSNPIAAERTHHEYSPSKLQPLEACPGFQSENSTNEASIAGTFMHDCIEQYIKTGVLHKGLDDRQTEVVVKCADFVNAQKAEMGPDTELFMEIYLPIDDEETTAGYLDIGLLNRKTRKAKICDWKTGLNPVEDTKNNLQGMAYMLGLFSKVGEFDECEVIFVMPFQGHDGLIDSHTFTRAEFEHIYLRICTIVARAKDAKKCFEDGSIWNPEVWTKKLNATDTGCTFCARKAGCPALHQLVIKVGKKYDPLLVPDVINPTLINNSADAGKALKFFAVMGALAASYRSAATNKAMTDENFMPDGYTISTMTRRKIVDNARFIETLTGLGFTKDEIMACAEFTLGPTEKLVSEKAPRGSKKAAVEELGQLLSANGATEEGAPVSMLRMKKGDNVALES